MPRLLARYRRPKRGARIYRGYKNMWLRYVQPNGGVVLREVRTFDAEEMLIDIARRENLSRTTLGHIKHFLSVYAESAVSCQNVDHLQNE